MNCTEDDPCWNSALRWVHSNRCQIGTLTASNAYLRRRVKRLSAALKGLEDPKEPGVFCDHAAEPCPRCEAARGALEL